MWLMLAACMRQAMDSLMPGFDNEIARLAQRTLIAPRKIDFHTGVLATKVTPGASRDAQPGPLRFCAPLPPPLP